MVVPAFMVIAHRGASAFAPENTFAAFDLALRLGARQIELDVATTRDGAIVVIHDDSVDRTTDGHGPVAMHSLQELRKLDAGGWFGTRFAGERIPLFEEVLARYKQRLYMHVELKGRDPRLARQTADLVRRHGMAQQATITAFDQARLAELSDYAPELPLGWLVAEVSGATLAEARAIGVKQLCPRAAALTPELANLLHAQGFTIRAWGVGNEILMRRVVEAGADGMTIDFPDKLIAYLRSRKCPWT